jgi:hypothetical protein
MDVVLLQQGPVHDGNNFLCFIDVKFEHFTWSQLLQQEHCTAYGPSFFEHNLQYQTWGPGFCSIPARISRSRISVAGRYLFFVRLSKNSV